MNSATEQEQAIAEFLNEPADVLERREKNAASQRRSYARGKRSLVREVAEARGLVYPHCEHLVEKKSGPNRGRLAPCGHSWKLEIDHWRGRGYDPNELPSRTRLQVYGLELALWKLGRVLGDDALALAFELRLACRRHNAARDPARD